MKILCLAQIFELEKDYGSDRQYYICRKMVELGHQVTVITSNIDYKTSQPKYKCQSLNPVLKNHNGIDIYYVYSVSNFQGSFLKRVFYYISYFMFSIALIFRIPRIDLVYAVSTPLTVGILGYFFCKLFKAKLVFEVTDLWPDVFMEMGLLKNRTIILILKKMELFCYRKAEIIIALSKLLQIKIQNRVKKKEKVILITNGVDERLFYLNNEKIAEIKKLKKRFGLEKKFTCMYLGAHGLYNSLNTIIEAANIIKSDDDIRFIFIGDGDEKKRLQIAVKKYKLKNVTFIPPVSRNRAPIWLQVADVFLLPNLKGKFYEMNLQNKFFDYLASAKPIIFSGSGNSADIIEESHSGKVIEAEDYHAMSKAVKEMKLLSQLERDRIGKNGRQYVLKHFERNTLTKRFIQHIEEIPNIDKKVYNRVSQQQNSL